MDLGNYDALWLLFALPVAILPACIWSFYRKRRALKILAGVEIIEKINSSVSLPRQVFKAIILMTAFVLIVIALSRPICNPHPKEIKRKGRDVVILLDVSRSMLAEDIKPNRLQRATIAINDMMAGLGGDRIAIVTFAGDSTVRCPLTNDYSFVRMVLNNITTESTTLGGTRVGDAIRDATKKVFDDQVREYRDIILITDGDDHDSFPIPAAEAAGAEGIRIIAIGLGDEKEGSLIPITGPDGRKTFLEYAGKPVRSRLDGDTLRKVALATPGGRYVPVVTGTFDLDEIYDWLIASERKRELESAQMMQYDEIFQLFLAMGIALIFCEALISERKKI
ncbi:MAG: VWA domain-containing protein [Planctomycetes bacterium]|nr:VWA domain-containing protein [Planctomycetota bacterium]